MFYKQLLHVDSKCAKNSVKLSVFFALLGFACVKAPSKTMVIFKALLSELLTELLSWFSSRNEFFAIFEFRVERHFFVIFGNFRTFGKTCFQNFRTFSKLFDPKTGFFDQKTQILHSFFVFDVKFG